MNIGDLTVEINIDDLTIGQARQLAAMFGGARNDAPHPYVIGKCYLVRTVTHIDIGRLEAVYPGEIVLSEAAWIADTGRWSSLLNTGVFDSSAEVEPFPASVIVSRGAICDVTEWTHPLPREVK